MKSRRRNRLTVTTASAPATPASAPSPIGNAYSARWLAGQALQEIEAARGRLATETLATWTADVAGKGSVDLPATVRAADSWKSRDAQMTAQQDALASLTKLLEEQIVQYKKSDAAGVIAVLKERIAKLQAGQDQSQREGAARRSELHRLLDELKSIDPEQPGHPKEGKKAGPKAV